MSDETTNSTGPDKTSQDQAQTPLPALPVLSYATPDEFRAEVRRDRQYIVLPYSMDLPHRCINCGQPAAVRIPATFNLVIPLRTFRFHVGLCRWHAQQRRTIRWLRAATFGLPSIAIFTVLLVQSLTGPDPLWLEPAGATFVACILLALSLGSFLVVTPKIWCHKSSFTAAWIGGAKEPFLDQLSPIEPGRKSIFNRDIRDLL